MALMVHEGINQTHDRHQYHAQEQGVDPGIFCIAGCGLGRHGRSRLKKDYRAAGGGQRKCSPGAHLSSGVTKAGYSPEVASHNATSVTQDRVTCGNNLRPGDTQGKFTPRESTAYLSLARGHSMMQNTVSQFRAGAIADLWVVCNWEGLDCFCGKLGLAKPSVRLRRAAVRRFSILACGQECIRQCGNFELLVGLIHCAGLTEGGPSGYWAGLGSGSGCAS